VLPEQVIERLRSKDRLLLLEALGEAL